MRRITRACVAILFSIVVVAWTGAATPLLAQIQVASANPNSAAEGTINLNIIVGGSGFKKGAKAKWFQSGTTNPGDVTVNSTAFNSSSQLTANITVSTAGYTGSYDIVVTNADGRTGKGTGLFSVTKGTVTACGTNVTSIVSDTDSNGLALQLQSDGLGPYVTETIKPNKNFVNSAIQGSCNYLLNMSSSQTRTVKLSLKYVGSTGATLPPGWPTDGSPVNVAARIESSCNLNANNGGISYGTMTYAGQTLQCPLSVSFYVNGTPYGTRMNPMDYAGTTWAQVACAGAASNLCNSWAVTPNPTITNPSSGQVAGIGELIQTTSLGYETGTPMGLFYISFTITLHE
jgi:hypothetical protein